MKLLDLINELKIQEEVNMADLTPEERDELFKKGSIMIPIKDPNRPGVTSASRVINLPKMDQVKREIIQNKQEFDVFTFSSDPDIKEIAKEINSLYNKLFRAMNALDKTIALKKSGRI